MRYTTKFFYSFIFLCAIFSRSNASVSEADSLFSIGKFEDAAIEYERQVFYAQSNSDLYEYKYKKALCYKRINDFSRSLEELQSIYLTDFSDSLYKLVSYEQSLCFYLNGEPAKALWKIDEYFRQSSDSSSLLLFMPIKLLSLNETRKWDEAKICFINYIQKQHLSEEKETNLLQTVELLYSKKSIPRLRSIDRAENWSRFLPGAGQIYAGKTGEGIINLLINSSVLFFAGYQMFNHFYITGYFAGLGLFNKTYHGGIKRAGMLAEEKNKETMIDFNRQINALIREEILSE